MRLPMSSSYTYSFTDVTHGIPNEVLSAFLHQLVGRIHVDRASIIKGPAAYAYPLISLMSVIFISDENTAESRVDVELLCSISTLFAIVTINELQLQCPLHEDGSSCSQKFGT